MNKSKTKIKLNEFSLTLVYIISESINMYSFSKNENKELVYFFLNAIDRMLFSRNLGNDIRDKVLYNIIFEILTNTSFFKEGDFDFESMFIKFGDEYNMRIDIYSKCNNLIDKDGPIKGTSIFALGYFLKYSSKKTSIELPIIKNILYGKSDVTKENLPAFLCLSESIDLAIKTVGNIKQIGEFMDDVELVLN